MHSKKRIARITGILYVVFIVCAGFSAGVVRSSLVIPGDAAATATNIIASEGLFRLGFATDLIAFLTDAAVSVLFYVLLKQVNHTVALLAAAFRLIAHPAIAGINLVNHYIPLLLLNGSGFAQPFGSEQLHALVTLFLNAHTTGYLIAGAFFGIHLIFLGYLLYKSELFPGLFGILIGVAAAGYLLESFGNFLIPGYKEIFAWIVGVTAVLGEVSLALWLLIMGVKNQQPATSEVSS